MSFHGGRMHVTLVAAVRHHEDVADPWNRPLRPVDPNYGMSRCVTRG